MSSQAMLTERGVRGRRFVSKGCKEMSGQGCPLPHQPQRKKKTFDTSTYPFLPSNILTSLTLLQSDADLGLWSDKNLTGLTALTPLKGVSRADKICKPNIPNTPDTPLGVLGVSGMSGNVNLTPLTPLKGCQGC